MKNYRLSISVFSGTVSHQRQGVNYQLFTNSVLCLIFVLLLITSSTVFAQKWVPTKQIDRELNSKLRLAQRLERQGQVEQAMKIYRYIVEKKPGNYSYYNRYVNLLFKSKDFAELNHVINRYLEYNPNNVNAIVDLGELYYARGDTFLAFKYWDESLERFNHSVSFYRTLFNGMIAHQLYDRAEKLFIQAREYHNKSYLFSLELASFYMIRGEYILSTREYLLSARGNPRNYKIASRQILRFPSEEKIFISVDSLICKEISELGSKPDLHRLRGDILFKFKRYNNAASEIFYIEALTGNKGNEILDFAKDLLHEGEYEKSEELYTEILQRSEFQKVAPRALLGLADAAEKSVINRQSISPLTYFFPGNLFFNTGFVQSVDVSEHHLQKSFSIYDSLIVTLPRSIYSAQALYRLAELRFKVTRDFDGALKLYRKAYEVSRDRKFRDNCKIRIGEVTLAKGDPVAASDIFTSAVRKREGTGIEKSLKVHALLTEFLTGEIDSIIANKNEILALLGIKNPLFNDVFEFMNFIDENYTNVDKMGKEAFEDFIKGELLVRQNKLSEAGEVYKFLLLNYPDVPVASAARFRLAQIQLQFGKREEAERTIEPILDIGEMLADEVSFMMAEVAHYRDNNINEASRWYELILERYPYSLYTDLARKRLREFQKNANLERES
ncbi:MAG: tetratricopeptide repeat protein [Candidatus Marinimicrobia bacterium]|nr:tetratricopeptide repeat protein [Candidatus Neomarinimicrobiota bacterium]